MRLPFIAFAGIVLTACNGSNDIRTKRMTDFQATQHDFDAIAIATFKQIDPRKTIETFVVPASLDARARVALRNVHPVVAAAPGLPNTLPAGHFLVREFSVDAGEATIEGQLGPVTGLVTAGNMLDCGKEYSVTFAIEAGDWVSHAYKTSTCAESRHWIPVDVATPQPSSH